MAFRWWCFEDRATNWSRGSFEGMCATLGNQEIVIVPGTHNWLIADPDAFGEVMTNVLDVVGMAGGPGIVQVCMSTL